MLHIIHFQLPKDLVIAGDDPYAQYTKSIDCRKNIEGWSGNVGKNEGHLREKDGQ